MKKVVLVFSLLASTIVVAGDYKFNIEGRSDLIIKTTESETPSGTKDKDKENSFYNTMVRLNAQANVNENLSLRFRYRFNKLGTDTNRDNSNSALDFAFVDHKNSYFTTRFGKQSWSNAAGRESMVSGSDVFLTSNALANFRTAVGEYRFGASAMFKFLEVHNLTLALSNPNTAVTDTTGNSKNNAVAYGAYYTASFMDKMIQPTLAYTLAPQDGDKNVTAASQTKKGNFSLMSAGLRSEVAGFTIDADYKTFKKDNRNSGTNTTALEETTKAIYFNVAYAINEFTPFATYINDKYTKQNTAASDYKANKMALGLMYKPFADTNFRYHVAYTTDTKKFSSSAATKKEEKTSQILFGIKADI